MPSEYIKKIRTTDGDKQIDYESLANLPKINNTELKGNVDVVEINQGSSNSGKFLGIGADGNVSPMDPPQGMTEEQEDQLEQNKQDISSLSEDLDNLSVSGKGEGMTCFFDKEMSSNIFDKTQPLTEHSQIGSDGRIEINSTWSSLVTDFISVENLGHENFRAYNSIGGSFNYAEYKVDRSFNENTTRTTVANNTLFSLDENTVYVRFEVYTSYLDSMMFGVFPDKITEYIPFSKDYYLKEKYLNNFKESFKKNLDNEYNEKFQPKDKTFEIPSIQGNLNSNESLVLDFSDIRKNCTFSFFGTVSSFGSIEVMLGENNGYASWLVIDSTKIQNYYLNKKSLLEEFEHGLIIGNVLGLSVKITTELDSTKHMLMADLCLTTDTGVYRVQTKTMGGIGKIKVMTADSTLTDCKMSVWCRDFTDCDLWGYGDSYFDTWTIYSLAGDGKLNMLMDNYTGRGSLSAIESLKKSIKCAIPKKVLWCMGMNDADSESAVNANWLSAYNELTSICKENNIELILCTIPNVPERNHNFKNAIIRSSGYRYADVSKAVGSEVTTSWYDGLLSPDKVHPWYKRSNSNYVRNI